MIDLRPVVKAAAELRIARIALEVEIRDLHKQEVSLRDIAKAAGISHEQVRRVVSR